MQQERVMQADKINPALASWVIENTGVPTRPGDFFRTLEQSKVSPNGNCASLDGIKACIEVGYKVISWMAWYRPTGIEYTIGVRRGRCGKRNSESFTEVGDSLGIREIILESGIPGMMNFDSYELIDPEGLGEELQESLGYWS